MPADTEETVERRATYAALSGLFMTFFVAFLAREKKNGKGLILKPIDLVMLGLATYRLGHLVVYDKVTEAWRCLFTETKQDGTGAGETVVAKGTGARRAIGELLSCPICAGTWIAAGLVYGLGVAPRATRVFLTIMSSIGVAELLHSLSEALKWSGQASRKESAR